MHSETIISACSIVTIIGGMFRFCLWRLDKKFGHLWNEIEKSNGERRLDFGKTEKRFDTMKQDMDKRFDTMKEDIDKRFEEARKDLKEVYDHFNKRCDAMDTQLREINSKVSDLNVRVNIVETRLEERTPFAQSTPSRIYHRRGPGRPKINQQ